MGKIKKKGLVGSNRNYITRRKALRRLQVSLKDFRRLCILKGIYPVEPRHKRKLAAGSSVNRTYFHLSDIQFLKHEPIIWKFWDYKIFMRKLIRAKGRRDFQSFRRIKANKPFYRLDDIVKERYPTFIDALRDIDDGLCMCALYSQMPKSGGFPMEYVELSRRLILEFMLYVIETRALRKVFVSIKGYYFQAEIKGQTITWLTPHQFCLQKYHDADYRVMKTFTEFYITLLGFINYKLYTSSNLIYPPKTTVDIENEDEKNQEDNNEDYTLPSDYTCALNRPLVKKSLQFEDDVKPDYFEEEQSSVHNELHQVIVQQKLFEGLKFFLNREVPREHLSFVIRSFGGQVSWDGHLYPGATYGEEDEKITHQIIDREYVKTSSLNRFYIQPQWVFDSVNAAKLLPVELYFYDVTLPPHLSPFVVEKEGDYVPPEKLALLGKRIEENGNDESDQEEEEEEDENEEEEKMKPEKKNKNKKKDEKKEENKEAKTKQKLKVKPGKKTKENKQIQEQQLKSEEKRLAVMMIPKKKKHLYDKIMKSKKFQSKEKNKLIQKRKLYDQQNSKQKKKVKFNV